MPLSNTKTLPRRATPNEVKLEAPGKGLPWLEHLVARYWILPRASKKVSWKACEMQFNRETQKILEIYHSIPELDLSTCILVPRLQGLEDSSRYWSAAMVLEHLVIVGSQIAKVIVELTHKRIPQGEANIARVKPLGILTAPKAEAQYEAFAITEMNQRRAQIGDQNSLTRFVHPWFGPITARQWNWLMGSHQYIHRKQLEQIAKGLKS